MGKYTPITVHLGDETIPGGNDHCILSALETQGLMPTGVNYSHISHDGWCGRFRGHPCNCLPWITVQDAQGRVVWTNRPRVGGSNHE